MRSFAFIVALIPTLAFAAPRTFSDLSNMTINIINGGIGVTIVLGLVVYFYGVATSIPHLRAEDGDRLRTHFIWGILALFLMVSVWGILNLVRNTLFGGGAPDLSGFSEGGCDGAGCLGL